MNYLVIGREGFNCDADNKTVRVFSSDIELTQKQLIEKFHKQSVLFFLEDAADKTWTDDDFEEAYSDDNGWNCVDMIFKSENPIELEEVFTNDFEE